MRTALGFADDERPEQAGPPVWTLPASGTAVTNCEVSTAARTVWVDMTASTDAGYVTTNLIWTHP